jgi:2-C-methyl-D-erythritol 4-phosphate cytidylyltransferase
MILLISVIFILRLTAIVTTTHGFLVVVVPVGRSSTNRGSSGTTHHRTSRPEQTWLGSMATTKNRRCLAAATTSSDNFDFSAMDSLLSDTGFVLLAGGKGSRMKASLPKQFLKLRKVPVLHYSLDLLLERLPELLNQNASDGMPQPPFVVLVLDPLYQPEYQPIVDRYQGRLAFASPGVERQGSVENGLAKLVELSGGSCQYVAIHDSARPLVTIPEILNVVRDAKEYGAAVLGVPCKATIKESEDGMVVLRTIPRARLWEVHTPQVIRVDTLQRGFRKVAMENLEVTDDVSIVEALGEPVKLTLGEYTNLKITTPEDMDVAEAILQERKSKPINMLAQTLN